MAKRFVSADNWCTSGQQTITTSFVWKINKFSKCIEKTGEQLDSSTFCDKEDNKTIWSLRLYPNGDKDQNKGFLSLFLRLESSDTNEMHTDFELSLINDKQEIYKTHKTKHLFENNTGNGWPQFIQRSELENPKNQLLPKDRLTIYCELSYLSPRQSMSGTSPIRLKKKRTLIDDMTVLYQKMVDSDIDIIVNGHKFRAHKAILKIRSPVFAAIIERHMKENPQNPVIIEDIDEKVFERVLYFIYTDEVVIEDIESVINLFSAAEKYNLEILRSICEEYIGSQLTVEIVCEILILADSFQAEELKNKAITFIKANSYDVMRTKGWMKIIERPDLLSLF